MKQDLSKPEWRNVVDFEGLYMVSSQGQVKSLSQLRYTAKGFPYFSKEKIMSPGLCGLKRNYLAVSLWKNKKQTRHYVHRLVARAFIGDSPLVINHKDNNPANNTVENLEWVTQMDNLVYANKQGRLKQWGVGTNPMTRYSETAVSLVRQLKSLGVKQRTIASIINCSESRVSCILSGKTRCRV